MGTSIKDARLVGQVTGGEKIPVSDGSGEPRAVTTGQIKEYIGNGGDDNVQSDWNETDPTSDAFIKNKPTIPSEVTEQTVTEWGFTKNTGDYSKPSAGIPKSDLNESVQQSLEKADTALQEHQDISGLATKSELNNKVDKVDGKQLSTEDFTALLKQKLDDLSNYDDTEIQSAVSKLRTDLDTLVSGDTTTAIKTFNEVIAFLAGISDTEDLASIIASIEQQIAAKGTVTSITAGDGLTGGTITGSGTIALEESGVTAKKYPSNTASWTTDRFVYGSAYDVKRIINMTGNITVDKYGRITNATLYNNGVNIYYPKPATTSLNGLMTASDKTKLDGIDMSTKQDKIEVVNHGTGDTTFTLTPNVYHKWGEVASLSLTLAEPSDTSAYNEYMFEFTSGDTATTLTLPDTISWVYFPEVTVNMIYQCSIVNNVGIIVSSYKE